jgi:glycosyltransferase involved in cell wall biosynthesis
MGQRTHGLEPHVVTRFGFPLTVGVDDAPATHELDGVVYHHLVPADGRMPARADDRMTAGLERLASLVEEVRPVVLHAASDFENATLALRLGELYHLPVVYEVRGFWEEGWLADSDRDRGSDAYRLSQERDTECMLRSDALVTLSEGMAAAIVERGIDRSRITVVPNGVDVDRFTPLPRDAELARRWGIRPDDVTIGYISRFTAYEGVRFLLAAAERLIGQGLPVRVVLVGDGSDLASLKQQASDLGIRDRVAFTGQIPHEEILDYYGLIDIFVVPRADKRVSHLVTPLKPIEAMATGRALIVSGVDALRSMVREGITAEVFRAGDASHLADVAGALVRDPGRRGSLGVAARAWVVENRSWSHVTRSYLDVYRRIGALA